MSSLKIHINPYTGDNSFYKNGIRIGSKSHSPFRNLTKSTIFGWINKLPSLAEHEMNDNYDLTVSAPDFETALIKLVMKGHPMCSSFNSEPFEVAQTVSERLSINSALLDKYGNESTLHLQQEAFSQEIDGDTLHIGVGPLHFDIVECVDEGLEFRSDGLLLRTPNKEKAARIIRERFVDIPYLIASHQSLEENRQQMSDEDRNLFDALLLTEPLIKASIKGEMEVGTSASITIHVVPKDVPCPRIIISVDNPIFTIDGFTITANDVGDGQLSISRADDPERASIFRLSSYRHNFATAVRFSIDTLVMEAGGRQDFTVSAEPYDAEDASRITVKSETPDIIRVLDGNIIEAVNPGSGVIVASCDKCGEKVQVEVLPKLESVRLDIKDNTEYSVGVSFAGKLVFTPSDAFRHTISVESSDSSVVSVEYYLEDEYKLKAKSIGNCELLLKDADGTVLQRTPIHVISTLYKRDKPSYYAFIALACLIAGVVLSGKTFPGVDILLGVLFIAALFLSLWSIFKEKKHYIISFLVAGLIIWALVETTKEMIKDSHKQKEQVEQVETAADNGTGDKK